MFRQSPSRNQRSKRFKIKHALQICLLLAICIWLLYQIKHSYDKKAAFDKSNAKISEKIEGGNGLIKFGRKGIHPQVEEMASDNEGHTEDEGTGEEEEEEESKHEDEEEESKPEESDEDGGDGVDEIDVQDQEREEEEAERGEDFIDEEEREREEKEMESQIVHVGSSKDQNHDRNTQEAREENYKGDDASSAVVRDTPSINNEGESGGLGNSNQKQVENTEENELELETKTNSTEDVASDRTDSNLNAGSNETIEGNPSVNATTTDRPNINKNSTAETGETSSSSQKNGTDIISDLTQDQKVEIVTSNGSESNLPTVVLDQTNSNTTTGSDQLDSDSTISATTENADATKGESTNYFSKSETIIPGVQTVKSNATAGAVDNSVSSITNENGDTAQSQKPETTSGTEEADDISASSTTNENADGTKSLTGDSINSAISQEEKEAPIDRGTLPDAETKGTESGDAAAE